MNRLLRTSGLVQDAFIDLADDAELPSDRAVIVSLPRWENDRALLAHNGQAFGVRLANTVDVKTLDPAILQASVIVLEFPSFGDGRAYSQARLLREDLRYAGELRATGAAVVRDQILGMHRCGIDAFQLRGDQSAEDCVAALGDLSLAYQPAADGLAQIGRLRRISAI